MKLKLFLRYFLIISTMFSAVGNEEVEKEFFDVFYYKKYIEEVALNNDLYRGEFLIYNCLTMHFGCVNDASFDLCKSKQETAKELGDKTKVCLPIRKFKNQPECFKQQYKANQKTSMGKFCYFN